MNKDQFGEAVVTFIATPLIVIIAVYLLGCAIAPMVNLNNQLFRILFTTAGGAPIVFFVYHKNRVTKKTKRTSPTRNRI